MWHTCLQPWMHTGHPAGRPTFRQGGIPTNRYAVIHTGIHTYTPYMQHTTSYTLHNTAYTVDSVHYALCTIHSISCTPYTLLTMHSAHYALTMHPWGFLCWHWWLVSVQLKRIQHPMEYQNVPTFLWLLRFEHLCMSLIFNTSNLWDVHGWRYSRYIPRHFS